MAAVAVRKINPAPSKMSKIREGWARVRAAVDAAVIVPAEDVKYVEFSERTGSASNRSVWSKFVEQLEELPTGSAIALQMEAPSGGLKKAAKKAGVVLGFGYRSGKLLVRIERYEDAERIDKLPGK